MCTFIIHNATFAYCTVLSVLPAQTPVCVSHTVFLTLIAEGDNAIFKKSLKQSLCCFSAPTQQLLSSQSAPAPAENGDWRTHTSMDQWTRWRPSGCWDESAGFATSLFTSTPAPHLRLRDCCKEICRGVVGGATSLISLHYFWPPTYHTPLHPVLPPSPVFVKERKTDICIASSYCTQFIWNLWVSIVKRAEEKNISL